MNLQDEIEQLLNKTKFTGADRETFEHFKSELRNGRIRAAERDETGKWNTNAWVKRGILLGFKMGTMVDQSKSGETFSFFDKDILRILHRLNRLFHRLSCILDSSKSSFSQKNRNT